MTKYSGDHIAKINVMKLMDDDLDEPSDGPSDEPSESEEA